MKTISLDDGVYAALVLSFQQAAGTTTPPVAVPPEVKPVEPPQPPVPPVQTTPIPLAVLMNYLGTTRPDLSREYSHVVEFSIARPDLQDPAAIVDAYLASVTHITPPAAVDVMYNAGTGYPIEDVSQADAFFLFRRGQQVGKKLWYPILQGRQSQIGMLLQRVEEVDIVAAQAFDANTYSGPLRPYVERFLATGSLTG